MPRDGSGVYSLPFPDVVTATTIASTVFNGFEHDIATDLNAPRPIVAGGTGANSAAAARTALTVETYGQVVTNYDSYAFLPGSFFSDAAATSPPVVGHAFVGLCAFVDGNNMYLEAYDRDDAAQPGARWLRQKKAGVWSSWAKAVALSTVGTPAANAFTTWQSSTALQGVAINGLVKGNGTLAPTAAVASTDYAPVTSGTSILKANNAGGFANAVAGTDFMTPALAVAKAGDTMTGLLVLSANPGAALGAATKQYVDAGDGARILSVKTQVFTASGTYTPSAGMVYCLIKCMGGGGGGGGTLGSATFSLTGGGGGAGAYSEKIVTAATVGASQTVTIGGGGAGGAAGLNNGNVGGDTSVGTLCVAKGGLGGFGASSAQGPQGGTGGLSGSGTGDFRADGPGGQCGCFFNPAAVTGWLSWGHGQGGSTMWGRGGYSGFANATNSALDGSTGAGFGAGGGGAASNQIAANATGGLGRPGVAIVTEFCTAP
jgi:hypothetical protein